MSKSLQEKRNTHFLQLNVKEVCGLVCESGAVVLVIVTADVIGMMVGWVAV